MTIETTHPTYNDSFYQKCSDCYSGDVVDYIPKLKGQTNQEYEAYRTRSSFFNTVEKTTNALIGIMTRKKPVINGVESIYCGHESSFEEFVQSALKEMLLGSRIGVLVDFDEKMNQPYLTLYDYPNIINWSNEYIVLREHFYRPSEKDRYEHEYVTQYRELTFDENGLYIVNIWRESGKKFQIVETYQPTQVGKPLTYIPFYIANQNDTTFASYKPPLLNLSEINIEHFKLSVDLAHGLHFTALPQPFISGDFAGEVPNSIAIGSPNVWQLTQGSQVGYLEFTGNGLSKIESSIETKQQQMAVIGSRMLQQDKKGVEGADTIAMRQAGENASLVAMVTSLESALVKAMVDYSTWIGREVTVDFIKDFTPAVDTETVKMLIDAYNQGVISLDALVQKMYESELIDDVQEELAKLKGDTQTP